MSISQNDMGMAPMPPQDAAAPPMPPEAMPAQASPEDVMAAQDQQREAQIEAIAAAAPQPEKPYTVKKVTGLVDAMNSFLEKVDAGVPPVEFVAEGTRIEGPLPADVFVPFVVVMSFVDQLGEYDKFVMQPEELVSDAAITKAIGLFKLMEKDAGLIEDLQEGAAPEMEEEEPMNEAERQVAMDEEDMDEDDEALMQGM
mgnify:FL=1|tara:strand:- start:1534 stop:2130 length:597 start_codon:yes stop_codon:yes gene_type:complete